MDSTQIDDWKLFWSARSPEAIASALRTIPKQIAYAWFEEGDGTWSRRSALDHKSFAARVFRSAFGEFISAWEWLPSGTTRNTWPTAEEAMASYDRVLRAAGWLLLDSDDGAEPYDEAAAMAAYERKNEPDPEE